MSANSDFTPTLEQDLAAGLVLEWAELYAADAVSAAERASIDEYLRSDPVLDSEFRDRVRRTREALTRTYAGADIADEPPAKLLDSILSRLPAQEPSVDGAATNGSVASPTSSDSPGPSSTDELSTRREQRANRQRRRSPSRSRRWIVAAAAAALIVVGGGTIAQNLASPSVQEQIRQADDVRNKIIDLPDGGTATVAVSRHADAAVVTFKDVQAPAPGTTYQMWRIPKNGSNPVPSGLLDAAGDTSHTKVVTGIDKYAALAMTVEPDGGSPQPTTTPFLTITL